MVEVLEKIAERSGSTSVLKENRYSGKEAYLGGSAIEDKSYSAFAEMYLERPVEVRAGFSVTICTWRGIPTIDDW